MQCRQIFPKPAASSTVAVANKSSHGFYHYISKDGKYERLDDFVDDGDDDGPDHGLVDSSSDDNNNDDEATAVRSMATNRTVRSLASSSKNSIRICIGSGSCTKSRAVPPSSVGLTAGRAKGRSHLGTRSPLGRFIGERRGQEERTIVASEPTLVDGLPGSGNLCRNVVDEVREPWMMAARNGKLIRVLDGWKPQMTCKQDKIARRRNATSALPPGSLSATSAPPH